MLDLTMKCLVKYIDPDTSFISFYIMKAINLFYRTLLPNLDVHNQHRLLSADTEEET